MVAEGVGRAGNRCLVMRWSAAFLFNAAAVANNGSSVALEALEGVDGDGVFLIYSTFEFVADGRKIPGIEVL